MAGPPVPRLPELLVVSHTPDAVDDLLEPEDKAP